MAEIDSLENDNDYVVLMTIHSAKGLEFPKVFLCGMEEGLFPGKGAIFSDSESEIEEERRLCYVAITRAMDSLTITCARRRMSRGELQFNPMSRFVREISSEILKASSPDGQNSAKEQKAKSLNTSASNATSIFKTKPFEVKQYKVTKTDKLDYTVGDTVEHVKFGIGKVLNITEGGRDYEVTVDFITAGQKKMFASFAKLKKI